MQLRHLRTFAAAADSLSFTRAAERVHLSQSSVTEQIQALETDLGTPLFDRSRRQLRLTPAGRRLLDYADEILALASEAAAAVLDAAGEDGGTLSIGGLETLCANWLPPLLAAFRLDHPAVRLRLTAAGSGALAVGLKSGELDVCFAFEGAASEPDLLCATVGEDELLIVAPAAHRLAGRAAIAREDLAGEPFLVTETGCTYRRMFDRAFPAGTAGQPRIVGEFGSIATIERLVRAGTGCAILPRLAIAAGSAGMAVLPWADGLGPIGVQMLWRRRRVQPPALRLFLDRVRDPRGRVTPAGARPRHAAPSR